MGQAELEALIRELLRLIPLPGHPAIETETVH